MRRNLPRSIEVCANIAIIIVAIAVVTVLVRRYLSPTEAPAPARQASAPAKGSKIEVDGIDWSQSETTLVLALKKGCRFCTESAAFYQRLAQQAVDRKNVRLLAVFPDSPEEAKQYLDTLKVPIDIKQSKILGVRGTPTLILVDSKGVVQQSWVGRLPSEVEIEVFKSLHFTQAS